MAGVTHPRGAQALRVDARDPRRRHRDRRRRVLRAGRPVGLRQVHAAADDRRASRRSRDGEIVDRRARSSTACAPKERDIAMVFQNYALYPHMTVRDNMSFALMLAKQPKAEIEARVNKAADILGLDAVSRSLSAPALRRPAAARRDGPRDRARSAGLPVRRAAVESRRQAARADAHRDQGAAPAAQDDVDLRHARPDRGDDDGRQDRRDEGRRRRADRRSARRSTTSRPTRSSPASSARRR